ncbi:MAG: RNA methyltransferase [Bacteroidales bacterium]|jgi:tRNA G18 (ribose-2'-O)-methylase SpoU|nr:RNA methyltransferase [Bacteroidales bacterium]
MKKKSIEELNRMDVKNYKVFPKKRFVVLLDNIRSMHNIGAIFRTADAFLIEKLYLCGITACPPNREIHKSALGATESVDWEYYENGLDAVMHLKSNGYKIVALEQTHHSIALESFVYNDVPIALIVGNEINGVSDEVMKVIDEAVEITQYGTKHSLNVSVSTGIAMWEMTRASS